MSNYNGLSIQTMVTQFQLETGHPVGDCPQRLNDDRKEKRGRWIREEVTEFLDAENLVDELDALADCLYYLTGTFVEMGANMHDLLCIVHAANMRKVQAKPVYEGDGRTAKPIGWQGPEKHIAAYLEDKYGINT